MIRYAIRGQRLRLLYPGGDADVQDACGARGYPGGPAEAAMTAGALQVLTKEGQTVGLCPLKHTDVRAEISGFVARVEVTQHFHNPYDEKIDAVYTFPLSQNAAVDDMLMKVGDRTIRGMIETREEAHRIYEAARRAGHVAGLLDQERPNIFTQSVANIMPGENVDVTIRYVELLKFEDSWYEFTFPMVVAPRYIPGKPISRRPEIPPQHEDRVVDVPGPTAGPEPSGTGWAPDTEQVPDASRITPPVTAPGTRAGHDICIEVEVDAGAPVRELESKLHDVITERDGNMVRVQLRNQETIPNKDFILRYTAALDAIGDVVLMHASDVGQFFALILQPPQRVAQDQVTPKEIVFVLDTSGSMWGEPIQKAKETMFHCLENLNPRDTFNLIRFSGDTNILFPHPVPATIKNVAMAKGFVAAQEGAGGTEMMKAIRAALEPSGSQEHIRIVCFMTDGYVGNDIEILGEIQRYPNARVFSFGIGSSANRFLLDNMARAGRGEVDYVTLNTPGEVVAQRFYERLRNPILTDIEVDWADLPVTDLYPGRVPDLFSAKPVVIHGRYREPAEGDITLRGRVAGQPFERKIRLNLPAKESSHEVLGALWARARIEDLMSQDWQGIQRDRPRADIKNAIVELGLRFRLVTQYTSFVAVEERVVTEGGESRTIAVPVEMPEGVSYAGVFGEPMPAGFGMPMARSVASAPSFGYTFLPSPRRAAAAPPPDEEEPELLHERRLAPELRGLAEKVSEQGQDGNLRIGSIDVKNGMIAVAVWLRLEDASYRNIKRMKKLGFRVVARVKRDSMSMVIGEIAVDKLEDLALLDFVVRIEPAPAEAAN